MEKWYPHKYTAKTDEEVAAELRALQENEARKEAHEDEISREYYEKFAKIAPKDARGEAVLNTLVRPQKAARIHADVLAKEHEAVRQAFASVADIEKYLETLADSKKLGVREAKELAASYEKELAEAKIELENAKVEGDISRVKETSARVKDLELYLETSRHTLKKAEVKLWKEAGPEKIMALYMLWHELRAPELERVEQEINAHLEAIENLKREHTRMKGHDWNTWHDFYRYELGEPEFYMQNETLPLRKAATLIFSMTEAANVNEIYPYKLLKEHEASAKGAPWLKKMFGR